MKKVLLFAAMAAVSMGAAAQVIQAPGFWDNWSVGIDAGVTAPGTKKIDNMVKGARPLVGVHVGKQVTPVLGLGAEMQMGVNTSRWPGRLHSATVIDNSYLGLWASANLFNFFGGYQCQVRSFDIDLVAGMGWGHDYMSCKHVTMPFGQNHVTGKLGFNFNFNVSEKLTIGLKPYVLWNLSNGGQPLKFNSNYASANLQASLTYHIGGHKFECVQPYNQAEIDALNGQINDLRAQLNNAHQTATELNQRNSALQAELDACNSRPVEVVKEVETKTTNSLNSVRFVFFRLGSSSVAADQVPNVEMIAEYMKHHPTSKVVIKGYASKDGNPEANVRLANKRAQSVKDMLINRFKIKANRIVAEGEGIGNMFEEESWNRVSICTIEEQD